MRVLDGLADQRARSAPRKRLLHEQMTVRGLSLQRNKQMPGLYLPGIERNATRTEGRARHPPGGGRDLVGGPERVHAAHSLATVTSSKGSTRSPTICPCSCPLPAISTTSRAPASAMAAAIASRRPPISTASGTPARTSARIAAARSEEHTSELQSLMRISYAVFCLTKKIIQQPCSHHTHKC